MMDVAYAWAKGAKFSAICKMTDVFEGSIIRCMRRQEELMRQLCIAARAIGNTELENKFAEGMSVTWQGRARRAHNTRLPGDVYSLHGRGPHHTQASPGSSATSSLRQASISSDQQPFIQYNDKIKGVRCVYVTCRCGRRRLACIV
jgi:hypothetical protein